MGEFLGRRRRRRRHLEIQVDIQARKLCLVFLIFPLPEHTGVGRAAAGGRLQVLCCAALDYFWNMFLEK